MRASSALGIGGAAIFCSFNPALRTGLIRVHSGQESRTAPDRELEAPFYSYVAGEPKVHFPDFGGGGRITLTGDDAYGAIRALDVMTGKLKWEYRMLAPAEVSTLATAGGLVFAGSDEGNFFALDAASGKLLWEFTVGGTSSESNLITYAVNGKQYLIGASGTCFVAFTLP